MPRILWKLPSEVLKCKRGREKKQGNEGEASSRPRSRLAFPRALVGVRCGDPPADTEGWFRLGSRSDVFASCCGRLVTSSRILLFPHVCVQRLTERAPSLTSPFLRKDSQRWRGRDISHFPIAVVPNQRPRSHSCFKVPYENAKIEV